MLDLDGIPSSEGYCTEGRIWHSGKGRGTWPAGKGIVIWLELIFLPSLLPKRRAGSLFMCVFVLGGRGGGLVVAK